MCCHRHFRRPWTACEQVQHQQLNVPGADIWNLSAPVSAEQITRVFDA